MTNRSNTGNEAIAPEVDLELDLFSIDLWTWMTGESIRILVAAAIAGLLVAILLAIKGVGIRVCQSDQGNTDWRTIIGRVVAKTKIWFIVATALQLVVKFGEAPRLVEQTVSVLFVIASTLQGAIWARELILGIIERRAGAEHTNLANAMRIVQLFVSVVIFGIAAVVILDNLGVNVTGLIAGLGIGGIAIGLAAQGIFSDLFAALSILFDRPFRRGDGIRWDATSGTVEQIGLKSTRLRSDDGQEVVISNANLLNKEVHNFANLDHRRLALKLGVTYQTPIDKLEAIPGIMRGIIKGHDRTELVRCGMIDFGQSSLDFELLFLVHSIDYNYVFNTRAQICLEILKAFQREGIEFAYPTQTTFTAAPDGTLVMPYPDGIEIATGRMNPESDEIARG